MKKKRTKDKRGKLAVVLCALVLIIVGASGAFGADDPAPGNPATYASDFSDPSLMFQFKVTVGAGDLGFVLPVGGDDGGSTYNRPYDWRVYWDTAGDPEAFTLHSGKSAGVNGPGIPHSYAAPGTYTITIVSAGSHDAWLSAFGFINNFDSNANGTVNRAKVTDIVSEFYPIMSRTQASIDSDAVGPKGEFYMTFNRLPNLATTGPGFNQAAWSGLTKANARFACGMYNSCDGNAFTMRPSFNLPQSFTTVGEGFAEGMFTWCNGSSFNMSPVFNLPQGIVTAGERFASALFNCAGSHSLTMNKVFNLPQGVSSIGKGFAMTLFYTASGDNFQINSVFQFPKLSGAQIDMEGVLDNAFVRLLAPRQKYTTIERIINGNETPAVRKYTFNGSVRSILQSQYDVFNDWYIMPANWSCGALPYSHVVYDGSGASSGAVPEATGGNAPYGSDGYVDTSVVENEMYVGDANITVMGNTGGLTKPGMDFVGWATTPGASAAEYKAGDLLPAKGAAPGGAHTITLYAVWKPSIYTLSFNAGAHGSFDDGSALYETTATAFTPAAAAPALTREIGWQFAGWSPSYTPGDPVMESAVYEAQWTQLNYTITYHSEGHTSGDVPAMTTHQEGSDATIGDQGELTREGYSFAGWDTDTAAQDVKLTAGDTITAIAESVDLYAVWTKNEPVIPEPQTPPTPPNPPTPPEPPEPPTPPTPPTPPEPPNPPTPPTPPNPPNPPNPPILPTPPTPPTFPDIIPTVPDVEPAPSQPTPKPVTPQASTSALTPSPVRTQAPTPTVLTEPEYQTIPETETPTTTEPIPEPKVPVGEIPKADTGGWSIISLMIVILALLTVLMQFTRFITKSDLRHLPTIASVILGVLTLVAFLALEDLNTQPVLINRYTILIAIIFIAELAIPIISYVKNKILNNHQN